MVDLFVWGEFVWGECVWGECVWGEVELQGELCAESEREVTTEGREILSLGDGDSLPVDLGVLDLGVWGVWGVLNPEG